MFCSILSRILCKCQRPIIIRKPSLVGSLSHALSMTLPPPITMITHESESQAAAFEIYLERFADRGALLARGVFVFRGVPGAYVARLHALGGSIRCLQSDRRLADSLTLMGVERVDAAPASMPAAVVFATKHREEVLEHLALAATALPEGGLLAVVASNLLGSPSLEKRVSELMGPVEVFSKNKCRVISVLKQSQRLNAPLAQEWLFQGSLRMIDGLGLYSAPGIFSWQKVDEGSRQLLAFLPENLAGAGADLGAGLGFLTRGLLEKAPGVRTMTLVEIEGKALQAARRNLAGFEDRVTLHFAWQDVLSDVALRSLDFVITNPPFHAGRGALMELGQAFLSKAVSVLRPGGRLYVVANRHLPYEASLKAAGATISRFEDRAGFKLIEAIRA